MSEPEPIQAYLIRNSVFVPDAERLIEMRERGFGDLRGKRLLLSPYETFYLSEKRRVRITDRRASIEFGLRELVERLSSGKPEIWIKYLVYRDLRDRGYIVREAKDADFEVHGKGALRRLVSIIYEGYEAGLNVFQRLLEYALREKKDPIVAVVDRRTDIVYYSLSSLFT